MCVCVCFTPLRRLLKTYSELGWYVRPLVLTVKHWAKRRKINDASSGTLSSYAYVILVIHFLQTRGLLPDLQADDPWQAAADGSGAAAGGGGGAAAAAAVQRAPVYDPVSGFNYAFAEGPHGNPPRSPAAPEGQHRHPIEARQRRCCGMFVLKTIILPRLARDKHRNKVEKRVAFLQVAKAAADADAEFLGGLLSGFVHYYAKELRWWEDAVTIHRVGVQVQVRGRVCLFEMPFLCPNDRFTKTGSGQT